MAMEVFIRILTKDGGQAICFTWFSRLPAKNI